MSLPDALPSNVGACKKKKKKRKKKTFSSASVQVLPPIGCTSNTCLRQTGKLLLNHPLGILFIFRADRRVSCVTTRDIVSSLSFHGQARVTIQRYVSAFSLCVGFQGVKYNLGRDTAKVGFYLSVQRCSWASYLKLPLLSILFV